MALSVQRLQNNIDNKCAVALPPCKGGFVINIENVIARTRLFVDLDENELSKVVPIANLALAYVKKLSDKDDDRLVTLAAAKTIYDYRLLSESLEISEFSAGDIKLSTSNGSNIRDFYLSCLEDVKDLVGDTEFYFLVV